MEQGDLALFLPLMLIFTKHTKFVPPHSKADLGRAVGEQGLCCLTSVFGEP